MKLEALFAIVLFFVALVFLVVFMVKAKKSGVRQTFRSEYGLLVGVGFFSYNGLIFLLCR